MYTDSSEKFLKPSALHPRREPLKDNREQPGTGKRIGCAIRAKAGYRVLKRVMEPTSVSSPVVLEERHIECGERLPMSVSIPCQ